MALISTLMALVFVLTVTFFSKAHGLGLWLLIMIVHGILYQYLGAGSEHIPLFVGIGVMLVILLRKQWHGNSLLLIGNVVLLFVVMAIAAMFGTNQENSLVTILIYARGFLLVLLLAGSLREESEVKTITLYCLVGCTIGGAYAFYQYMTNTFTVNSLYVQRAAGLRGDPNDTAMLLVVGIPIAVYWLFNSVRRSSKLLSLAAMAVLLVGIVLTGSRGGFVALLLVIVVLLLRRPSIPMFGGVFLLAVALLLSAPQSYKSRMGTLFTGQELHNSKSLQNRKMLQMIGVRVFLDNPLIGVGPGNFSNAFMDYYATGGQSRSGSNKGAGKTYAVAHNMYLEFFAENGAIGGILFLSIFILCIRQALRYDRLSGLASRSHFGLGFTLALALAAMLFAGLFLSQGRNSVLWFVVGMGFALAATKSQQKPSGVNIGATYEIPPALAP